jgi:hypothetical protein
MAELLIRPRGVGAALAAARFDGAGASPAPTLGGPPLRDGDKVRVEAQEN